MFGEAFDLTNETNLLAIKSPAVSVSGPYIVVHRDLADRWALVALDWNEKPALGIRWFWGRGGHPFSSAHPTWFILPEALQASVLNSLAIEEKNREVLTKYIAGELAGDLLAENWCKNSLVPPEKFTSHTWSSVDEARTYIRKQISDFDFSEEEISVLEEQLLICTDQLSSSPRSKVVQNNSIAYLVIRNRSTVFSLKPENLLNINTIIDIIDKLSSLPGYLLKPFPLSAISIYKALLSIYNSAKLVVSETELVLILAVRQRIAEGPVSLDLLHEDYKFSEFDNTIESLLKKHIIKISKGKIYSLETIK